MAGDVLRRFIRTNPRILNGIARGVCNTNDISFPYNEMDQFAYKLGSF